MIGRKGFWDVFIRISDVFFVFLQFLSALFSLQSLFVVCVLLFKKTSPGDAFGAGV